MKLHEIIEDKFSWKEFLNALNTDPRLKWHRKLGTSKAVPTEVQAALDANPELAKAFAKLKSDEIGEATGELDDSMWQTGYNLEVIVHEPEEAHGRIGFSIYVLDDEGEDVNYYMTDVAKKSGKESASRMAELVDDWLKSQKRAGIKDLIDTDDPELQAKLAKRTQSHGKKQKR